MSELAGLIQDAELEVMKVFWKKDKALPLSEIRSVLSQRCDWEDSTIKTLVRRLLTKGIIKLEQRGIYSAVVSEHEYNQWSSRAYVNKVFSGSAKKLVASLLSDGQLTEKDIAELSAMFNGDKNEQ